jgi:hypothetical protein
VRGRWLLTAWLLNATSQGRELGMPKWSTIVASNLWKPSGDIAAAGDLLRCSDPGSRGGPGSRTLPSPRPGDPRNCLL